MAFEPKKYSDIFDAMRQSSSAAGVLTDFDTGSVTRTISESFAYEMALLYEKMRLVYLSAYVDTAEGQQLDMVVAVLGIVRGEPDYAQGVVTFHGDVSKNDTGIPAGTLVATEDKPGAPKKVYQTVDRATLGIGQTDVDARVQAVNRGEAETAAAGAVSVMPRPISGIKSVTNAAAITFTGKKGESDAQLRNRAKNALISSGKATLVAIENALLSLPNVSDVRVIEYFDESKFGLIDVFVDGVDLTDAARKAELTAAIDQVRAAGIFARLQQSVALNVEAVFQIQISPDLKVAPDDRADMESKAAAAVSSYMEALKMGQSLLMSQITKSILTVEGVTDLVKYAITVNGTPVFEDALRSLDSQPSARFQPVLVCAASEVKALPIDLRFKATAGLTVVSAAELNTALTAYMAALKPGATVAGTELLKRISDSGIAADTATLGITPHSWCGQARVNGNDVNPKFVEKPSLGLVFAYSSQLFITGALRLTISPQLTGPQQNAIEAQVRQALDDRLASLKSGEGLVFADLIAAAKSVSQVQDAQVNTNDFRVHLDNVATDLPARISDKKIEVQAFEKVQFDFFCVSASIRVVAIEISKLNVTAVVSGVAPVGADLAKLTEQIKKGIAGKPLLAAQTPGQNVAYNSVKGAIEALVPAVSLTVTDMTLGAVSQVDNRSQAALAPGTNILIRSVEIANIIPVDTAAITVVVHGTLPTPPPIL